MSGHHRQPHPGQTLIVEFAEADAGAPIHTAELEVVAPPPGTSAPEGAFDLKLVREDWASEAIREFNTPAGAAPDAADASGGAALEVTRFVWDFIKDNKPVSDLKDTVTSVIIRDTHSLDYAHAKEFRTKEYVFTVRDRTFPEVVLVQARFRLEGAYAATPARPEIPFGHYLPSLHFNVLGVSVAWLLALDGHAEVSQPINLGPPEDVQPQVRLYAKLKFSWPFGHHTFPYGFVANGVQGGWGTGPESAPAEARGVQFDRIGTPTPQS